MKPAPFEYLAPDSISQALDVVAEHGYDAKVLAGGQSIVPAMNFRLMEPSLLVDLNRIDSMSYVNLESNGELRIGAMTRQRVLELDRTIESFSPLLHEVIPSIAHAQIRNRGTIGGSLVHADPAAELPVTMVALDGRFRLRSNQGERWVQAGDFFQGILTTAIEPEEIMDEIAVPPLPDRCGTSFLEFARRKGDYALIGVAVVITLDTDQLIKSAKIVYLNAGATPMVAVEAAAMLIGQQPGQEVFTEAAAHAVESEIEPMGDIHATVPYRKHLARVLTKRALVQANARIIGGPSQQ